MTVFILTGLGEISKRQYLLKLKQHFDNTAIIERDLKTHDISAVKDYLISSPLFTDTRLVILENSPSFLNLEELATSKQLTLVILTSQLSASSTLFKSAKLLKAKIIDFAGEKEISAFPFIDGLIERKSVALSELVKLLEIYGGMYVLSMVYYLFRRNILPLPKNMFFRKKITTQKSKYNFTDFANMYQKSLQTEYKIKSGLVSEKLGLTRLVQLLISFT